MGLIKNVLAAISKVKTPTLLVVYVFRNQQNELKICSVTLDFKKIRTLHDYNVLRKEIQEYEGVENITIINFRRLERA